MVASYLASCYLQGSEGFRRRSKAFESYEVWISLIYFCSLVVINFKYLGQLD